MKKVGDIASAVFKHTGDVAAFLRKATQFPRDIRQGVEDLRDLGNMLGLGKRSSNAMPQVMEMMPQKRRAMM